MEKKDLPIVYLEIDVEDMESGVTAISFVDSPATEVEWMTFKDNKPQKFEKKDVERMITGPVMLAETPIYRYSPVIGDYFVKFSEKTVFDMMKKYFKENRIHTVNEQHNSKRKVKEVYMVESYIINERTRSEVFSDLNDGTWMASFFEEDEDYWNEVVMNGDFKGFSLEGMFTEKMEDEIIDEVYSKIEKIMEHPDEDYVFDEIKRVLKIS
jgi:hypothetical protein